MRAESVTRMWLPIRPDKGGKVRRTSLRTPALRCGPCRTAVRRPGLLPQVDQPTPLRLDGIPDKPEPLHGGICIEDRHSPADRRHAARLGGDPECPVLRGQSYDDGEVGMPLIAGLLLAPKPQQDVPALRFQGWAEAAFLARPSNPIRSYYASLPLFCYPLVGWSDD